MKRKIIFFILIAIEIINMTKCHQDHVTPDFSKKYCNNVKVNQLYDLNHDHGHSHDHNC